MDKEYKKLVDDYHEIFGTSEGKRILADLRKKSTYDRSSVSGDKRETIDPYRLAYDEGQRAMIIYIIRKINEQL